jgi:ABC-type xylose transport system substrate-binding protein
MSRAMNVTATEAEVKAAAAENGALISAIETILSGGTRVVFMNGSDAERMRRIFEDQMVVGAVTRSRWVRNN